MNPPVPAEEPDVAIQQSPLLEWIDLQDDRGVDVWHLDPSFDHGSITSFSNLLWATMIEGIWDLYSGIVALAIWFISWVLAFGWVELIAAPMRTVGSSLHTITTSFGIVPLFLTIAAIGSVFWMMRGKWSTGVWELFSSLIIAALLTGALASPISIVGAQDGSADQGLVHDARDMGIEIAAELTGQEVTPTNLVVLDSSPDPDLLQQGVNSSLVTTFLRTPLQLLNFGIRIDETKCEEAYTKALNDGPYLESDRPQIRDAIKDGYKGSPGCGEAYLKAAEAPGPGQVASAIMLLFAALILLVFGIVLSGSIILAVVSALYQSLRLMVTMMAGLLPGVARGSMWLTFGNLAMSLILIVFSVVFTAVYILLINSIMGTTDNNGSDPNVMMNFLLVDVMLIVGIIIYWRARSAIRNAGRSVAQAMAWRPGGDTKAAGATPLPAERSTNLVNMGMNAAQLHMLRRLQRGGGDGPGAPGRGPAPPAGAATGGGPAAGTGPTASPSAIGPGSPGPPTSPAPTTSPGGDGPGPTPAPARGGGGKPAAVTGTGPKRPGATPIPMPARQQRELDPKQPGVLVKTTKTASKLALLAAESTAAAASGGTSAGVSAGIRAARTTRKAKATVQQAKRVTQTTRPADPRRRPQVIKGEVIASQTWPPPRHPRPGR